MSNNPDLSVFQVAKRRYDYNLDQIAEKYSRMDPGVAEWDLESDQIFVPSHASKDQIKRELKSSLFNSADAFGFTAFSTPYVAEEMSDIRKLRVMKHNKRFERLYIENPEESSESDDGEVDDTFNGVSADAALDREYDADFVNDENAGSRQNAIDLENIFSPDELAEFDDANPDGTEDLSKTLPARFSDDDDDPTPAEEAAPSTEAEKKEIPSKREDAPIASRLRRRATTVCYSDTKRRKTK